MVPLIASEIDEPTDDRFIVAAEYLPPHLRHLLADESRVVDWCGKSDVVFQELTERYCFVGGEEREYLAYLHRPMFSSFGNGCWPRMCRLTTALRALERKTES